MIPSVLRRLRPLLPLLAVLCAHSAVAAPVRLLLAIGNDVGDPLETPLQFAVADARRIHAVFLELGEVAPARAFLLENTTATQVRDQLVAISGRVAELQATGQDVQLVVYYSGHGGDGALHLRGTHLPVEELSRLVAETRADLRVVIVDACESGTIARLKGGRPGPAYDVRVEREKLRGQVMIASSGPAEPAQEWRSLNGSLFTHHLITGLRGDADAEPDGRVSLNEAYSYTFRRTVLESAGDGQTPSFDLDVTGSGDLVLTRPATATSALVFPPSAEGHFVLASHPRPDVIAEVRKTAGRSVRIAVPAGRYLLRKRLGSEVGLIKVELPYGGEAFVDEQRMIRRHFAEVAMKGGDFELHPSALLLGGTVQTPPLAGTAAVARGALGYRHTWGEKWTAAVLSGGYRRLGDPALRIDELASTLTLSGGLRWFTSPVMPYLGLLAEASLTHQTFTRDREAEIRPIYGPIPARNALGFATGLTAGVEVPLFSGWFLLGGVDARLRYLPVEGQPAWTPAVQATALLGFTL